ncbi:MAG: methionine--tRNA ligase [Methanomassiliicoccales archaeon]|nr:methionine--tRNA ligase [Methanomassiliicoccales archaeon]
MMVTVTKYVVNVAWPYANGAIHVGHVAGSLLSPDIFSRYQRMRGNNVLMVSGSDQHGTSVVITAEKEGISVDRAAEMYHKSNKEAIEWLGIQFDLFTKTHTQNHFDVVQSFFRKLYSDGHLYAKTTDQYYCTTDKRFLADTYVSGTCPKCGYQEAKGNQCEVCKTIFEPGELNEVRCTLCSNPVVLKGSEQLFFSLSAFSGRLHSFLSGKKYWRQNVLDFSLNWISSGLDDRSATRDLDWGIPVPVPGFEKNVIYVWFEAVIGYLSASIEWARNRGEPEAWKQFWQDEEARHYYFMGKDNIPFHTIIWPAMMMAHGDLVLPYDVVANEYLTPDNSGMKFSKSRGGAPEIRELMRKFTPEQLRYYLTSVMPEGRDSVFRLDDMVSKVNNELVATLGNYFHRVLSFSFKNFGELKRPDTWSENEHVIRESVKAASLISELIEGCEFKKALKALMDLAQSGNQYFDRCAPWFSIKTDRTKCSADLFANLELIRRIAILSFPFLPFASASVMSFLGYADCAGELRWDRLDAVPEHYLIKEPKPVFSRIDPDMLKDAPVESPDVIPLDLRVGKIISARKHPSAEKLLLLEVDTGERRQIVAGLRQHYAEEALVGMSVVVVANLATAKLRGYESQGMMLAAESGGAVKLLRPYSEVPVGRIGEDNEPMRTISIDEFRKVDLRIAGYSGGIVSLSDEKPELEIAVVVSGGKPLPIRKGDVFITVDGGRIGVGSRIR